MASDESQRNAFRFLTEHLQSQDPFTREDLRAVTSWGQESLRTYWTKHVKPFVVPLPGNRYRVSEAFRPYSNWKQFKRHVTQMRPAAADYRRDAYDNVVIYEFYMPLSNEQPLRMTLDALFYKDTVLAKLRAIGFDVLSRNFACRESENEESYLDRLCSWIGLHFGGYSIYHVEGRFRAAEIATRTEIVDIQRSGDRYLVDETTAVTRFIFPCKDNVEVEQVRFFFDSLFAQSIVQVVNGEDEIWMVESGMSNRVHVWRVKAEDEDAGE